MKKLWIFRNWINFTGSVLAVSAVGLYTMKFIQERPFSHPVVTESVKVISKNERVRDLLGFPVSYVAAPSNQYVQGKKSAQYYFKVQGPRGKLDTQLHVTSHEFNQISKNAIEQLSRALQKQENQMKELKASLQKQKNKTKTIELNMTIQEKQLQVEKCKIQLEKQKVRMAKKHKILYVPDKQQYSKMLIAAANQKHYELTDNSQNLTLWSIDKLQIQLPNRNKITLIDTQQKTQLKPQEITQDDIKPITLQQVKKNINQSLGQMSEEEIAAFSKYKNQYMYTKYGYIRGIMTVSIIMGGYFVLLAITKNKTTSLVNSVILHEAQKLFLKNAKIRTLMSYPAYTRIKWNHKVVGGGKRGQQIDCIVDVQGIKSGKVTIKGTYDKSKQQYQYKQFDFQYRDFGNEIKKIDLLN